MDAAAASRRADDHPSVRRPSLLARDPEEILLEIRGDGVIVEEGFAAVLVAETPVEDVQGGIVARVRGVGEVVVDVVELETDGVAVVVGADFESVVAEASFEIVDGPRLVGGPPLHGVGDDARQARLLESLAKLRHGNLARADARDVVAEVGHREHVGVVRVAVLGPLAAAHAELGARRTLRRAKALLAAFQGGELGPLVVVLLVLVAPLGLLLVVLGVVLRLVGGGGGRARDGRARSRRLSGRGGGGGGDIRRGRRDGRGGHAS